MVYMLAGVWTYLVREAKALTDFQLLKPVASFVLFGTAITLIFFPDIVCAIYPFKAK